MILFNELELTTPTGPMVVKVDGNMETRRSDCGPSSGTGFVRFPEDVISDHLAGKTLFGIMFAQDVARHLPEYSHSFGDCAFVRVPLLLQSWAPQELSRFRMAGVPVPCVA